MYSVRRRMMLVLAIGFAGLILGTGYYVNGLLGERVTSEFDAALLARARAMVTLTEWEDGHIEFDYVPEYMPEFEREERPDYFEFYFGDGTHRYRSTRLDANLDLPLAEAKGEGAFIRDAPLPDGRAGRILQITFKPKGPDPDEEEEVSTAADEQDNVVTTATENFRATLVVARGRDRLDQLLARMQLAIFGGGGIASLLAVLLVWRALAAGFRPLDRIAAQVRTLDAESLGSRVALQSTPKELAPIKAQLNALLERLEDAFARERRFTANVAHELRTPIAELRSLAEVGAKWPDDKDATVGFFHDVHDVAGRMEGVIADLLLLARCQAGVETAANTPTSLRELVSETWSKLSQRASGHGLQFSPQMPDDMVVASDPGKLGIVFANVLGNAVSYAPPNSEIRCVGKKNGERFQLDITNAAEPMTPADLKNLAEPFWRKDEARSSGGHAGLGLSVVSALAALMGLEVRFEQDADGTFRVRLEGRAHAEVAG
ncbi:MAG: sensor histidine kinase [Planctomycetota bacterium]|jgi:two-component system sensor histidine kinase QseC